MNMCTSISKSVSTNVCIRLCKIMSKKMNLNESEYMYKQDHRYE